MSKKEDHSVPGAPSWQEVLLVCKACGKRSSGPKHLKGKAIVADARRLLRAAKPRPRVLMTACLGLCPKGAIAVARVGGSAAGAQIVAVESLKQFERLLPMLAQPETTGGGPARAGLSSAPRPTTEVLASEPFLPADGNAARPSVAADVHS